ncbi:MAG: glycerophosphodiester phosphodiesterase family protein [Candidatus Aminicenantes bacterium]
MKMIKGMCFAAVFIAAVLFGSCRKGAERIWVVAHRGASSLAPENTLAAVRKALELGADCCEIDVRMTEDKEIVLMHDARMKRTAGISAPVWEYTLAELAQFEVGSWFGQDFNGEPIPTLKQAINAVKGKMWLNIEIKVSREEPELVPKVVDIIHRLGIRKKCMVTSFDRATVEKIKDIDPKIKTGFIFGQKYPSDVFEGNWDVLSCNFRVVDPDFVAEARERNKEIHVWTVDETDEMKRLIELGVDGIITNRPQDLMPLVR